MPHAVYPSEETEAKAKANAKTKAPAKASAKATCKATPGTKTIKSGGGEPGDADADAHGDNGAEAPLGNTEPKSRPI